MKKSSRNSFQIACVVMLAIFAAIAVWTWRQSGGPGSEPVTSETPAAISTTRSNPQVGGDREAAPPDENAANPGTAVGQEAAGEPGPEPRLGAKVYEEIAVASGGVSIQSLRDIDLALDTMMALTDPGMSDIALVEGDVKNGEIDTVVVPVDDTIGRLELLVTSRVNGAHLLEVLRPNTNVVGVGDPDATIVKAEGFNRVRIEGPTAGAWAMKISGMGKCA